MFLTIGATVLFTRLRNRFIMVIHSVQLLSVRMNCSLNSLTMALTFRFAVTVICSNPTSSPLSLALKAECSTVVSLSRAVALFANHWFFFSLECNLLSPSRNQYNFRRFWTICLWIYSADIYHLVSPSPWYAQSHRRPRPWNLMSDVRLPTRLTQRWPVKRMPIENTKLVNNVISGVIVCESQLNCGLLKKYYTSGPSGSIAIVLCDVRLIGYFNDFIKIQGLNLLIWFWILGKFI